MRVIRTWSSARTSTTPLLVARAGRDTIAGVNTSIDAFVPHAVTHNLALTFINHHTGPHAFDLDDDSLATQLIVRQTLTFLTSHLHGDSPCHGM